MKKTIRIISLVFITVMLLSSVISASTPYTTYTYSKFGFPLSCPDAYVPEESVDSVKIGLDVPMSNVSDIESDEREYIYITDKGNNRIIVLNKFYKLQYIISTFVNEHGVQDYLSIPSSTFIVDDGKYKGLYVCDTFNARILVFDQDDGSFLREIDKPESELFGENAKYSPISCVVDKYGRLYVVSEDTTEGIIVMTAQGDFINFIGAPKVTISALEALQMWLSPGAAELMTFVPTTFISLDIDSQSKEFVYATIIFTKDDEEAQKSAIISKSSDYSPVKLLNAKGDDIMNRNGFFAPSGEVITGTTTIKTASNKDAPEGVSNIKDVSSGPNGVWSIIDSKRSKVYTYDKDGNLLYIFGDKGNQLGNIRNAIALTYQGNKILVLDVSTNSFTVYRDTDYAKLLNEALHYQETDYTQAVAYWEEVLLRNNNFDTAYVEIGKALYRNGEYEKAMEYYKNAYDTENYSVAYKEVRRETMVKFFIPIIIGIVVFFVLLTKVFQYAGKVNKRTAHKVGKKTFKEELLYGFHVMFHPFDGYWDIKHEKRGSVRASIVIIAVTILAFYYQTIGRGYCFNPLGSFTSIFSQIASILLPFMLWVIANWCFTTLFDGEGSFKDIFIASSYALFPVPGLVIVSTILTNFLVPEEGQIVSLLISIAYIWLGLLIIIGMQVTHDYSMGKNIVTIIMTIVGMVIIMFLMLLFTTLISKMASFVQTIASEISYR